MSLPSRLTSLVVEHKPVCHGFQNVCACERCLDRELRSQVYAQEGLPNAATAARRDSEEYFLSPWRFDKRVPPRRLGS